MAAREQDMESGIIFDIKEFAILDGPGLRTTVFLKGCPLRCRWCHNPEGMSTEPQIMRSESDQRLVGERWTADRLATHLNGQASVLRENEGGVTFSGGEPLMQAEFVAAVVRRLDDMHVLVDTAGHGSAEAMRLLAGCSDLIHYDLKLMDPDAHQRFTGKPNGRILENLKLLDRLGVPTVIRVPLVPGLTDIEGNLAEIAHFVGKLACISRVELLPYNRAAGGKYAACGMRFDPGCDEDASRSVCLDVFREHGLHAILV